MERFKNCLNLAITKQAMCVRFIAGGQPQIMLANQTMVSDGGGPMTAEQIKLIMNSTMPGRWFTSEAESLLGNLNIGDHGILGMRGRSDGALRIDLYFPASGKMYEDDVLEKKSKEGANPSDAPANPSAISIPAFSIQMPAPPAIPPIPAISIPVISIPAIPIPVIPIPVMSIPAMSIPAMSTPAISIPAMSIAPAPEIKAASSAAQPEEESMFQSGPAKRSAPAAVTPPAMANPMPMTMPVPQNMIMPMVIPATREEIAEINFGNDVAGEGQVSHGENAIDALLKEMVKLKASDIHLTVGQPIILRIHGDISRISEETITADMMSRFMLPTFPKRNHKEFLDIQDTDYAYELKGVGRFRVNVYRDRNGVGAVMRHIPADILSAEQLGLSAAITKLCHLSKGLVLVTGPTGSGKSTTLAAMLDLINSTRKEHILTIEDPIEFVHPQKMCLVNQREVRKHTGSFGRALKAALREDPDDQQG